jgi:hypothetical protein
MTATPPDYLLIGHITADLTPNGRIPGGTVSYAARTAAAFGLRVGVLTSMAVSEPLLDKLRPYAEIVCLPAEQTTTFENIYEPEGRRQYVRGVAAPIEVSNSPPYFLRSPLVHLAPIIGEGDPRIAHLFKDSTVLLTLQGWLRRLEPDGRVRFKRWYDPDVLKSIDIVVFSEEDIVEAPDMEQDFARSVKNLFVTRAEQGGTYYRNGEPLSYDTPQVEMVNPTGAGDVFAASLLASLPAMTNDLLLATKVAARLGAICVTRPGLEGTPTSEEVQAALQEAVRV